MRIKAYVIPAAVFTDIVADSIMISHKVFEAVKKHTKENVDIVQLNKPLKKLLLVSSQKL